MKIITISREFGSGGRELGRRLADVLDFDYYDKEIITAIAKKRGLDETYVARTLENHGWRNIPLNIRQSFAGAAYIQSEQVHLLLEQKRVIEEIAKNGKNCVIVGRNADVILKDYGPFNMFICADKESKINRCKERAAENEKVSEREMEQIMKRIDKSRAQTREMIFGSKWGERSAYHLTVNTSEWDMKVLSSAVAQFVNMFWGGNRNDTVV